MEAAFYIADGWMVTQALIYKNTSTRMPVLLTRYLRKGRCMVMLEWTFPRNGRQEWCKVRSPVPRRGLR